MPWTWSMASGLASGWPVHESTMDSPRGQRQRLTGAQPSDRSGPWWLAARVETGRARRGVTGGILTGARMMARRQHTDGGASVPSGHDAGAIEEGRRRGEGMRCSTRVWGSFIGSRGRRGRPGTAGGGGNWRLHGCHYRE
jgi:hypothetical protein